MDKHMWNSGVKGRSLAKVAVPPVFDFCNNLRPCLQLWPFVEHARGLARAEILDSKSAPGGLWESKAVQHMVQL